MLQALNWPTDTQLVNKDSGLVNKDKDSALSMVLLMESPWMESDKIRITN